MICLEKDNERLLKQAIQFFQCGDSNAPANAKSEGAKAPAYETMVAEGTVAALQYRKNESKAFAPLASAFAKCIWAVIFIYELELALAAAMSASLAM